MNIQEQVNDILNKVDTSALLTRSLTEWRPILSSECQVYVFGENYLAKRFDQINYKFCEKNEAKEILIDNLYALLRYKYFPQSTEEVDERIQKIIGSFTVNLKTTLKKVSFDLDTDANIVEMLPDHCIAFRNGVFDFKANDWLFKYQIIDLKKLANKIYMYDTRYVILWYLNYDFEPWNIDVKDFQVDSLISMMKERTKHKRNYCFELMYNIAHDVSDQFDRDRFTHLCEILGYTILQSFSQFFVLLIGSGQNGKNSLFDGCFTHKIIPRPASNDLDSIEADRFITGSLENRAHNIFLETSAKTYTESKMIKALTGSMYQTIESKGINKYSSVINCKYLFAGNDQDKIKFSDNTTGFRRRINMFEIWYRWDSSKRFLTKGDYFDTTFSDSLVELKNDNDNISAYVYFGMYGILHGTKGFTKNFQFTLNDWNEKYSDVDLDMKEKLERITPTSVLAYIKSSDSHYAEGKTMFYDMKKNRLYMSSTMKDLGYNTYEDMLKMFEDIDACMTYFSEHDAYICVRSIQNMLRDLSSPTSFTQSIKKIYGLSSFEQLSTNKPYVKCTFGNGGRLRIIKD